MKKRKKPSKFKKLRRKLQRKGHSKQSAQKIAAYVGRRKYGAKKMAKKAAAARKRRK